MGAIWQGRQGQCGYRVVCGRAVHVISCHEQHKDVPPKADMAEDPTDKRVQRKEAVHELDGGHLRVLQVPSDFQPSDAHGRGVHGQKGAEVQPRPLKRHTRKHG